jgi:hypothetical protein
MKVLLAAMRDASGLTAARNRDAEPLRQQAGRHQVLELRALPSRGVFEIAKGICGSPQHYEVLSAGSCVLGACCARLRMELGVLAASETVPSA